MNRGRHKKKYKDEKFYTAHEIIDFVSTETEKLLNVHDSNYCTSIIAYYIDISICNMLSRCRDVDYVRITSCYISKPFYYGKVVDDLTNFFLFNLNIPNNKYLIKFKYGKNTKIFKYKA